MPQVQVIQPIQQQPKRLRVAAYARVSTKSNEQLHSMSVQTEYYEDLIQKNPNWEFVGVYADEGISGTSIKHRAELNRLMEDCRAGMIDRILVKSASRMARNAVDLLTIIRELKSIGVAVQFEKEQFDTDSATGEMMLSMMCAIAQEESLSISKNMKWGIRKKMQTGTYVNCATPFGYRQQDHQLVLEKNEAAVVRLIFEKYLSGVGIAEIARYLNKNHPKEDGRGTLPLCNSCFIMKPTKAIRCTKNITPRTHCRSESTTTRVSSQNTVLIKATRQSFRMRNSRKCRTC